MSETTGFKISTKKWHYKLIKFVLGDAAPTPQNMHNLCPYFWLLIFSMFAVSFKVLGKFIYKTISLIGDGLIYIIDNMLIEPTATAWFNDLSDLDAHRIYTHDKGISANYLKSKQGKRDNGYHLTRDQIVNKWYKKTYKKSMFVINEYGEESLTYSQDFIDWRYKQQNVRAVLRKIAERNRKDAKKRRSLDISEFIETTNGFVSNTKNSMAEWKNIIKWTKRFTGGLITGGGLVGVYFVVNFIGRSVLWLIENFNGEFILARLITAGIVLAIIALVIGLVLVLRLWVLHVADKGLKLWYAKLVYYPLYYIIYLPIKFIFIGFLWEFIIVNLVKLLVGGTILVKESILSFLGIFGEYFGGAYTDFCAALEWEENEDKEDK